VKGYGVLIMLVTISAMAVGAGYWLGFLWEGVVRTEKLEIASISSELSESGTLYLNIWVENNGTADARLEYIVANGIVAREYLGGLLIPCNSSIKIELSLSESEFHFQPGSLVELRLHTSAGNDLTQSITVPEWFTVPEFERVEITSCYAVRNATHYAITVELKNSGSVDVTMQSVSISPLLGSGSAVVRGLGQRIRPGSSVKVYALWSNYVLGVGLFLFEC